jgi:hypothetical protein
MSWKRSSSKLAQVSGGNEKTNDTIVRKKFLTLVKAIVKSRIGTLIACNSKDSAMRNTIMRLLNVR